MTLFALAYATAAAGTLCFAARKSLNSPKPYSEVREDLFELARTATTSKAKLPARSARLDKRLPAAKAAKLRRLSPPTKKNWEARFEIYSEIVASIRAELSAIDRNTDWYDLLSPARRAVILADNLELEVNNGGFDQFYLNSSGDGAAATPDALRVLGCEPFAMLVERCNSRFAGGPPTDRTKRLRVMDRLGDSATRAWNRATNEYFDAKLPRGDLAVGYGVPFVLKYESEFFKPK